MKNLKTIRKARGLTQSDLAEMSDTTQPTIQRIESGWDGCTLRSLNLIADALNLPTWHLLMDESLPSVNILLETYNSLSDNNKAIWDDMAVAAKARTAPDQ